MGRLLFAAKTVCARGSCSFTSSLDNHLPMEDVSSPFEAPHRDTGRPSGLGQCGRRAIVKACMCARVAVLVQTFCVARVLHRRVVPTDCAVVVPRPPRRTAFRCCKSDGLKPAYSWFVRFFSGPPGCERRVSNLLSVCPDQR